MARKDSARGKAFELAVGRRFGGRRRRNGEGLGFDDCIQADGSHLPISLECKSYATLQLQSKWIEQARRNAGERPWAVVQRPKGSRTTYVTCDLEFFLEMYAAWLAQKDLEDFFRAAIASTAVHPPTEGDPHDDGGST